MFKLTDDAYITNGDFCGEDGNAALAIFAAHCTDEDGNTGTAYWYEPDWDMARGEDYSDCCDWDRPDEIIWD